MAYYCVWILYFIVAEVQEEEVQEEEVREEEVLEEVQEEEVLKHELLAAIKSVIVKERQG